MDAPTTKSADNGTSGGGDGWFTPRKQPEPAAGGEQGTSDGRRLAALRPVGRGTPLADADPRRAFGGAPQGVSPDTGQGGETDAGHRPETGPQSPYGPSDALAAPLGPSPTTAGADALGPPPAPQEPQPPAEPRVPVQAPQPVTAREGTPAEASPQPAPSPSGLVEAPEAPAARPSAPTAAALPSLLTDPVVPAQRPVPSPDREASPDAVLIRRTMAEVGPVADKVTSYFYALLFVRHPGLRPLFPPAMDAQRDRLLKALLTAAEHIDNTPVLVEYLQNLGRGHRKYGTRAEHYPAVGECLIGALNKYADAVWDAETEAAWVRAYTTISQVMIDAAAADELRAPPWWQAEIVSHDLRTPDVAVLTLRPDQPYPFRAGQYASLETPWWPRIWRHYSFASAPRSDGLLAFHVKAVPAGWVSNALVHRARPGDVVRLGPPAGSMTVDHTRDSGLLCLGGGTGIAPIKALVEDVAEHGARRPVEVFYGARTDHDLYDIDTMLRLQQTHSWLEVHPVVDRNGLLQLPDAIRTFGPWTEYDAYVSGPPGMIRSGVDALRGVGFPAERIRHDSVEELVAAGS
ncbi:globin domain-containing protein [Streptomyces sp. NBC_00582]|uniref:globin domain-containing protein n=1 Tax=Streptomyces sp. NBC_00582 TaxID=2975783 RepID=UPI002E81C69E|nr:globin domain-containing protein [Streptomyces sp. NBC_00582]WUB63333.1 FAD-binding oxidoreductase [Streptomyces sp. NBC_00582]